MNSISEEYRVRQRAVEYAMEKLQKCNIIKIE